MTRVGRIVEIWRYPVSSLGGERLEQAELDGEGIAGDRLWGLAERDGGEVARPERRRWRPVAGLGGRTGPGGIEIGEEEAGWLPIDSPAAATLASARLGFPVEPRRHVPFGEAKAGRVAPRYRRSHLHLLTSASLRRLAALLPETARVDVRRFRPNLVVETEPGVEGFAELELVGRTLSVGAARLLVSEPCKRCAFTTLAQPGLPLDPAVLQTIARAAGGSFGALCQIETPAPIGLGDPVALEPVSPPAGP